MNFWTLHYSFLIASNIISIIVLAIGGINNKEDDASFFTFFGNLIMWIVMGCIALGALFIK